MYRKTYALAAFAALALVVITTSGCDQLVSEQTAEPGIVHRISNYTSHETDVAGKSGSSAKRHSNSVKYRDSSKPNASASQDGTTLTGRTLLGSNGMATLEVTTGELDAAASARAPSPALITKVQVKSLDPEKRKSVRWTKNFNGTDAGYGAFTFDDLQPGWPIVIHANIKGLGKGTTVVRMEETVKLRPDLVSLTSAPESATINDLVSISASVREMNGDVGANADCVLYADGFEIDRVDDFWVDAGDEIGCQFEVSFAAVGAFELVTRVESVVPADYLMANNRSEPVTITIEDNAPSGFSWYAWADIHHRLREINNWWTYVRDAWDHEYFSVQGSNQARAIGFPVDADVSIRSGDFVWHEASLQNAQPTRSFSIGATRYDCFDQYDGGRGAYMRFYFCSYEDGRTSTNNFGIDRRSYSHSYVSSYMGGGYYSSGYGSPPIEHNGSSMSFSVSFTGANGVSHLAEGTVPLSSWSRNYRYCYDEEEEEYESQDCSHYELYEEEHLSGWASGTPEAN